MLVVEMCMRFPATLLPAGSPSAIQCNGISFFCCIIIIMPPWGCSTQAATNDQRGALSFCAKFPESHMIRGSSKKRRLSSTFCHLLGFDEGSLSPVFMFDSWASICIRRVGVEVSSAPMSIRTARHQRRKPSWKGMMDAHRT